MYDRILHRIQALVAQQRYRLSTHADEERVADQLTAYDIEAAILSGSITERQRDHDSGEWKYVIIGSTVDGRPLDIVAKIVQNDWVLIITVYVL
jgi:hypothetical protein